MTIEMKINTIDHPKRTEIEEVLDAYLVMHEIDGTAEKFQRKVNCQRISANSFKHTYCICVMFSYGKVPDRNILITRDAPSITNTVVRIKHNMLTKEIMAEIDETRLGLNMNKYKPFEPFKKCLPRHGFKGFRFIQVALRDAQHLLEFLNAMKSAFYL